ncbi:hypothetical protein ACFYW6_38590 [Streptomyces sp. NPDC002659]|uniref:hypothetical protein n=1 Tax=Streptomyces sp. NPDC002659 TaxID=3364656 RepID=UPI0036C0704D
MRLDAAAFGDAQAAVTSEARHLVALRTLPEVKAAIAASFVGQSQPEPVADLYAFLGDKGSAA